MIANEGQVQGINGAAIEESGWLTLGCVYPVMSIRIAGDRRAHYLLVTSSRTPAILSTAWFPAESFDVVNSNVPSRWVVERKQGVEKHLPEAFTTDNFFELLFDRDLNAEEVFDKELAVVEALN